MELKDVGISQTRLGQGHLSRWSLVGLVTAFPLVTPVYPSCSLRQVCKHLPLVA